MEPESGHVGSTLQKTRKIQILCDFLVVTVARQSLWSQQKVSDGALLLNLKDSYTNGLKKLLGSAGRGYFP